MIESSQNSTRYCVTVCCNYVDPNELVRQLQKYMNGWGDIEFHVYSTNEHHVMPKTPSINFTQVDNKWNDFTGYMHACRELSLHRAMEAPADRVYLFLNDTVLIRHPARLLLRRLRNAVGTIQASQVPILVGRADSYRMLLQTSPFAPGLDQYISTFLFATNFAGIQLLNALFGSQQTQRMMSDASQLRHGELPPAFHAFLSLHLTTSGSLFSWKGDRSESALRRKAGGVLLEHLISAEFFKRGFIFPLNYHLVLELYIWIRYRTRR